MSRDQGNHSKVNWDQTPDLGDSLLRMPYPQRRYRNWNMKLYLGSIRHSCQHNQTHPVSLE